MLNQNKHRKIMFEILKDIYQSELGFYLGFKGGTMLYFFYNLNRFSVDLDFDLLDATKEEFVLIELEKILKKYGKIDDIFNKKYTLYALLNYEYGDRNLKIEISKRRFNENKYEIKNLYGVDMRIISIEDAFAHKLVAVTDRQSLVSRDFYDIYFFWKNNFIFNEKIIITRTGKTGREYLEFLRKHIQKNLNQNNVLKGLGDLLTNQQKDWLKKNLKKELLIYIDFSLQDIKKL